MDTPTVGERLRYRFDNLMARGPAALILLLAIVTVAVILVLAVLTIALRLGPVNGSSSGNFLNLIWLGVLHTLDTGSLGGDTGSPVFIFFMLLATITGILIVGGLIGVITTGIDAKLSALRRGRSAVVEQDHTLILGWSPQIFTLISELAVANENRKNPRIVILADRDKVEMEEEIKLRKFKLGKTRVVCRTGSPLDLADLDIVRPRRARSIIVLAPEEDDPDTHVIKTILAITNHPHRKAEPYHIVAQIRDAANLDVARMVGRDEAELILGNDLIARITVQTCRQSGLSVVYTELLDFDGDEIYFQHEPSLVGKTFGDALFAYENSAVMGLHRPDGATLINPPMDTVIQQADEIIAISEDDDTVRVSGIADHGIDSDAIQAPQVETPLPERTLILGWNSSRPSILAELEEYVAPGSTTTVVAAGQEARDEVERLCVDLHKQVVQFQEGDPTERRLLESLDVGSYDHIIVLTSGEVSDPQRADAKTLITLLLLRELQERLGRSLSIVSEMLDLRNRELASVTRADDFIVSDQLVSLMLSQISENKHLSAVFADLLRAEGSEIYLKPANHYVRTGAPTNFYTVLKAAQQRDEVAIGYRLMRDAEHPNKGYGVTVNPRKSEQVQFEPGDRVIVLAES